MAKQNGNDENQLAVKANIKSMESWIWDADISNRVLVE